MDKTTYHREWARKNKDKVKKNRCRYLKKNREKINKTQREWCKNNREKIKEITLRGRTKIKNIVFTHYGEKCVCCGESELKFLTIDHINNDGGEFRKKHKLGGYMFYVWITKNDFPKDLQILCWNCNMGKGIHGICPHKNNKVIPNPD